MSVGISKTGLIAALDSGYGLNHVVHQLLEPELGNLRNCLLTAKFGP